MHAAIEATNKRGAPPPTMVSIVFQKPIQVHPHQHMINSKMDRCHHKHRRTMRTRRPSSSSSPVTSMRRSKSNSRLRRLMLSVSCIIAVTMIPSAIFIPTLLISYSSNSITSIGILLILASSPITTLSPISVVEATGSTDGDDVESSQGTTATTSTKTKTTATNTQDKPTTFLRKTQAVKDINNATTNKSLNTILRNSGKAAFRGGFPGFIAGVIQVRSY